MENFQIGIDIELVTELLDLSEKEIANKINVSPVTISRWKENKYQQSDSNIEAFYNFVFSEKIRLNKIKEQLYKEDCKENSVILFHGAKTNIQGSISLEKAKDTNDFGKGFYCGENLEQSAMFVSNYPHSSLYILDFCKNGLSYAQLNVDRDWMLLIAYFRNKLENYKDHPVILDLLTKTKDMDYIIAPIADNKMFQIIDSFINGEITDVQCQHCLSATNLGNQYVLISEKAISQVNILCHCYLSTKEKEYYLKRRQEDSIIGNDKVKIAKREYRNQGKYIEEILL